MKIRCAVLCVALLVASCDTVNPPIDARGTNCANYGVSEEQRDASSGWAFACPKDDDGLPFYNVMDYDDVQTFCRTSPDQRDRITWGCIDPSIPKIVGVSLDPYAKKHEQCHCILGLQHHP